MKKLAKGIFDLLKAEGHLHEGEIGRGEEGEDRLIEKLEQFLTMAGGCISVIQKMEGPTIEESVHALHVRAYGDETKVPETYRKLLEEVGELGAALMNHDRNNLIEETGDVLVILLVIIQAVIGPPLSKEMRHGAQIDKMPSWQFDITLEKLTAMSLDKFERRLNKKANRPANGFTPPIEIVEADRPASGPGS